MGQKKTGLSLDLLTHPGETLKEALIDRNMTQEELANRAGVTQKHISTVINGNKPISVAFAKKLQYVLGIDAEFWMNLQNNYNLELEEINDINNITKDEILLINEPKNKKIIDYLEKNNYIDTSSITNKVISLRGFFEVADLTNIKPLSIAGVYRKSSKFKEDPFIMFAWHKICYLKASQNKIDLIYNRELLINNLCNLKAFINEYDSDLPMTLKEFFSNYGISFNIVKNFIGAPINAFTRYNKNGYFEIFMTLRNSFADIFWFSLFHEIGHILNGDVDEVSSDLIQYSQKNADRTRERKADKFAEDILINKEDYVKFIKKNDFSIEKITKFAKSQNIPDYIVIGRLQKEKIIRWDCYSKYKHRYKWA